MWKYASQRDREEFTILNPFCKYSKKDVWTYGLVID
jgi:hypothetical protein